MRSLHIGCFDDFVGGTTTVSTYSDPKWNTQLAMADALRIFAVADQVAATGTTLTVAVEESGDNRNFLAVGTAPINAQSIPINATTALVAASSTPPSGFVRLKITLAGTTATLSGHIKIYVTGRGEVITSP